MMCSPLLTRQCSAAEYASAYGSTNPSCGTNICGKNDKWNSDYFIDCEGHFSDKSPDR